MDNSEATCLVTLDLSAALDTVNHNILLECLNTGFGIGGIYLSWLKKYLNGCIQKVVIQNKDKGQSVIVSVVSQWMSVNMLKINVDKTEVIL